MSDAQARDERHRAVFVSSVFLASIPVAFVDPALAPLCWLVLFGSGMGRAARRGRT
jgi:hypothetical protein